MLTLLAEAACNADMQCLPVQVCSIASYLKLLGRLPCPCVHAGAEYNLDGFSKAQGVFGVFNALGTVAFAYGGHNVILEIQVC